MVTAIRGLTYHLKMLTELKYGRFYMLKTQTILTLTSSIQNQNESTLASHHITIIETKWTGLNLQHQLTLSCRY